MTNLLDKKAKQYIIDCIDLSGHNMPNDALISNKINLLSKIFNTEYGGAIKRIGTQPAISLWLRSSPGDIHLEQRNDKILELAVSWGSLHPYANNKQKDKILKNYYQFMANKLYQLFKTTDKALNKAFIGKKK